MRIAVISDVHSNYDALQAVVSAMGRYDALVCLGDLVGYGAEPNEVVSQIRSLEPNVLVMGNHDYAVSTGDASGFVRHAVDAIEWTRREISPENVSYISAFRSSAVLTVEERKIAMVHGSPRDPLNEYVYPDFPEFILKSLVDESGGNALLMGHTHVPFSRTFDAKMLGNPGSVGQPRDGDPNASYGVLEVTDRISFEIHRVSYDIEKAAAKILRRGLPRVLAARLYGGM